MSWRWTQVRLIRIFIFPKESFFSKISRNSAWVIPILAKMPQSKAWRHIHSAFPKAKRWHNSLFLGRSWRYRMPQPEVDAHHRPGWDFSWSLHRESFLWSAKWYDLSWSLRGSPRGKYCSWARSLRFRWRSRICRFANRITRWSYCFRWALWAWLRSWCCWQSEPRSGRLEYSPFHSRSLPSSSTNTPTHSLRSSKSRSASREYPISQHRIPWSASWVLLPEWTSNFHRVPRKHSK